MTLMPVIRTLWGAIIVCALFLFMGLPITIWLADKHPLWFAYWAGWWFAVILALIIYGNVRRYLKLKRLGYWVNSGRDTILYVERNGDSTRQLEIDGEPGAVYMPSEESWNRTMPDWAKGRRSEIEGRLKSELKNHEFT